MQPKRWYVAIGFVFALAVPSGLNAQNAKDEAALLMNLDRQFDKATAERGIEGWVSYFAPNGSMLGDTNKPVTGATAIREAMEPAFNDTSFSLRWQPVRAEMMIPDVVGYTVGRYERIRRNKEAKSMLQRGTYTSVWKKQPDGLWKIILDTGQPDGPAVEK